MRILVLLVWIMLDCRYYKILRILLSFINFRLKIWLILWMKLCYFLGKWWVMDFVRLIISGRIWVFFFGFGGWSKVFVILRCFVFFFWECIVLWLRVKLLSCWNGFVRGNGKDLNGRKRKISLKIDRRRIVFLVLNVDGRRYCFLL